MNLERRAACLLAAALVIAAAPLAGQQVTLKQVLSAPFATELIAGPVGGKVAWVENVLGARNIWVAESPGYKGRQLTHYTGDNGKYLVQLAFTPDGEHIVYVSGGAHTGRRSTEPPNPTLDPGGGREEVWIVSLSGGEPKRIDDGVWPAVSARGDLVAYIKRGQIWAAPLVRTSGGIAPGDPQQLIHDRGVAAPQGNATSLRWSPTGHRLVFVSIREEHSFIGVYDADRRTLLFLDPSFDRDQEPIWSMDGRRVAFIRVPSAPGERPSETRREAQPWSIRVADAETGRGREVWRAKQGMGSAFWGLMNNERQLFWGAGDRIAFPWERTGWVHLYSVSDRGGDPEELTPGEFEVEHVASSPDGRELVFSSNQADIDRRHLWRVPFTSGPPQPVTSGSGIEYWPVFASDGVTLTFLASGAKVPPQVEMVRLGLRAGQEGRLPERQVLAPGITPKEFPAAALVEPQQVVFPSTDGLQIHAQLFLPPGYGPQERYPAVAYFHGGSRAQMVLGYHYHRFDYYQKHYAFNQYLANHGYIVLSVNYRSGTGYGMKFREADGFGASGATEVRDVIGAGQYLRSRKDVDPDRIGVWGGSYGGYLTGMGLARAPDLFAAGFDLHGVQAWDARLQFSPYSPLNDAERDSVRRLARESSPMGNVATWRSPVLIVHGDDDRNVDFSESVALVSELKKRGVPVEELVLPNETHSFLLHSSWMRAFEAAADFFDRKLKPDASPALR